MLPRCGTMAALCRLCECLLRRKVSSLQLSSHSCHGPAVFDDLIDPATCKPLIQGKTITGFTTEAEVDMKILDTLKSWGNPLVEETAERMGAKCESMFQHLLTSAFARICGIIISMLLLTYRENRYKVGRSVGRLFCDGWPSCHRAEPAERGEDRRSCG